MTTAEISRTANQSALAPGKHRRWWQEAVTFAGLSAVAVILLELLFATCGIGGQEFLEPDPKLGCRQIPGKQVTWRLEGFSNDYLSSSGHRDVEHEQAKPVGTKRIMVLGDSATEGLQVPLGNTYCRVLERHLNSGSAGRSEVLNFGCSSYSTGQQVLQFEQQAVKYHPDLTVLLYVSGAALQNVYNPYKRVAEARPYFFIDSTGRLQEDDSVLLEQATAMQPNAVLSFLRKNSRIYGVLSQTNLSLSIHEKLYHKIRGWLVSLMARVQPAQSNKFKRLLYPPQDVWPVTSKLITRLNDVCLANGSKLIVMIFPNTVNDPVQTKQIAEFIRLSKQERFGLLDLTPAFKANPDPSSLFLQYHFSSDGHKVAAEQLAAFLKNQKQIDGTTAW
jgi:lysophospholipase L1-like esterase